MSPENRAAARAASRRRAALGTWGAAWVIASLIAGGIAIGYLADRRHYQGPAWNVPATVRQSVIDGKRCYIVPDVNDRTGEVAAVWRCEP